MQREYIPVLMIFAVSLGVAALMVLGSHIFSSYRRTPVKSERYEPGIPQGALEWN